MKRFRVAENQVRAVEKSREMWRTRAEAAEAELRELKKVFENPPAPEVPAKEPLYGELIDGPKVPGSSTPMVLVVLALRLVLEGGISMRAASRITGLICELIGVHRFDGLSHATVQDHLLRIGLDQLNHGGETSSDRVWIMDHMIAAGSLKCLIVLEVDAQEFAKPVATAPTSSARVRWRT